MFTQSDIMSLGSVSGDKYHILTSNCHDITICSLLTGHDLCSTGIPEASLFTGSEGSIPL